MPKIEIDWSTERELERLKREDPRLCNDCEKFLEPGESDFQCDDCHQRDLERPDGSECGAILAMFGMV